MIAQPIAVDQGFMPYNQVITVDFSDCKIAATTNTLVLFAFSQRKVKISPHIVQVGLRIGAAFVGQGISAVNATIGNTSTPDLYCPGQDLVTPSDAGSFFQNWGFGTAFATSTLATSDDIILVLTATGGNLSALTAGKLHIYFRIIDTDSLEAA